MSARMLSKAQQDAAVSAIREQARSLDKALYAYHFEGGDAEAVLKELAAFQNPDGGFGHGLEPDLRLSSSSVIATTIALQVLRELHVASDHKLAQGACRYLVETYDKASRLWPIVPENSADAPHAPWWSDAARWLEYPDNPRAEIAGYLHEYSANVPSELRDEVTEAVIARLLEMPDEIEMHELLCFVRLYETPALPEASRQRMADKLEQAVKTVVVTDPQQWHAYGLPPLSVAPSPDSAFAGLFSAAIPHNLDFVIDQQQPGGYWSPAWSWAEMFPDAWKNAEREICGLLTLRNLVMLRDYGRLE